MSLRITPRGMFFGFTPGYSLQLFNTAGRRISLGEYKFGRVEIKVLRGELLLEPVESEHTSDPKDGPRLTSYTVVSYTPGTVFEMIDWNKKSGDGAVKSYLAITPDEVPPGATTTPCEWRDAKGSKVYFLTLDAEGNGRPAQLNPSDPISPVVMTGLPVSKARAMTTAS